MSMGNGNNGQGQDAETRVRQDMMLVATRDFEAEYDGQRIELKAGFDRAWAATTS
jgi:hypothetical protein